VNKTVESNEATGCCVEKRHRGQ